MINRVFRIFCSRILQVLTVIVFILAITAHLWAQEITSFTYNGRLSNNGTPAVGNFQFEFKLFAAPSGGNPIAVNTDVNATVTNGVFNVTLDFGNEVFDGTARYLEVGVRPQGSSAPYTTFTTRQPITSTPYTIRANTATIANNLACTNCVQDSNINSVSGDKVTGAVANATNAANLGGQPASAYLLSGGNVTFGNVSAGGLALTGNAQIVAARVENLANDPEPASSGNRGRIYFNTTTKELKMSSGTEWRVVGGSETVVNVTQVQPVKSPLQIATLAWWETHRSQTFNYDFGNPRGMYFDGTFLYVGGISLSGQIVSPIQVIDSRSGVLKGSFSSGGSVDLEVKSIVSDGSRLWFAPEPSPASRLGTFNNYARTTTNPLFNYVRVVGVPNNVYPEAVLFDGDHIWASWSNGMVTKSSPTVDEDNLTVETLCTFSGLILPRGMAFDGNYVWVAESGSNKIAKLNKNCETNSTVIRLTVGTHPYNIAFDGKYFWITNEQTVMPNNNSTVTRIEQNKTADRAQPWESFPVGKRPRGIAFDGANIWVANWGSNTVTKLRASDGSLVGTYPVGTNPESIVFDGLRIWVTNSGGYGINDLTRF